MIERNVNILFLKDHLLNIGLLNNFHLAYSNAKFCATTNQHDYFYDYSEHGGFFLTGMKLLYFHPKFTCKLYISLCLKFAQIRLCYIQGYDKKKKQVQSLNLLIVDTVERVENTCYMGALSKQIQYFKVILKRKGGGDRR